MLRFQITVRRMRIADMIVAGLCLAVYATGFAFVSRVFGFSEALLLSLLLMPPLVVAVRLRRRWPRVHGRELAFLAILFCVASGGVGIVIRDWYATGMVRYHAEDVKWTKFERLMRRDAAFGDVKVSQSRKHTYWASGTVASEADLDRLRSLASRCGIDGRLDGPFVHSVSLTVRAPDRAGPDR